MGNVEKFDRMADRYDTPERIRDTRIIAEKIESLGVHGPGKSAIDFGCGTGLVGKALADKFGSMRFIDASERMIEQTRKMILREGLTNAEALCLDLTTSPPPEGLRADVIFMAQVLLHIRDIEPLLARLRDMLHDGGHLIIVDFDFDDSIQSTEVHPGFSQVELRALMKRLGFARAESETFHRGERMFMNRDASMFVLIATKT